MDSAELEDYFITTWAETVKKAKDSLYEDDRETVELFKSHKRVADWLLSSVHSSLTFLRPALGHLLEFTNSLQSLAPGLDTSHLWGSLACLLQIVSKKAQILDQVPRMVKSLALKSETFNGYYKRSKDINNTMKEVAFDVLLQIADFFTTSIKHIRAAELGDRGHTLQGLQQRIQTRYEIATIELGEALSRLEKLNTIAATRDLPIRTTAVIPQQRCLMTPLTKTSRLFDRLDVFIQLDELLRPDAGDNSLNSVALHGLGGVGKSSIGSSYAEKKYSELTYDVVLWVCGENDASLRQSFTDIAIRLKLAGANPLSHVENQVLVQDWFRDSKCRWLVVYDNVESADTLAPYWPPNSRYGRAIITTRNRSLGFEPAASDLEVKSWDAETGAEYLLFLLKKSIGRDISSESASAKRLAETLSGHALALSQMAGLIYDGEYTIQEFTTMYYNNPRSAHALDALAALWDIVFQTLDKNTFTFLGIVSFLMPDSIPPEILEPKSDLELPTNLMFLRDKLGGLSAVLRKLTTRSLVKRDKDSKILTMHRLVQTQFRYYLDAEQRQKVFQDTLTLLSSVVPKSEMEKGQLYDGWDGYNYYLQHVLRVRDIFEEEHKSNPAFKAPRAFCEMLNDYQRYLYERCNFDECERTCAVNRIAVSTLDSESARVDLEGTIVSHQAQVVEKLGNFREAADICQRGIDLRLTESPMKKVLISYSYCNLGIVYSSANDFPKSLDCFRQSQHWWKAHFDEKEGDEKGKKYAASILVSEARCMTGLGKLDAAEKMLNTTIKQVTEEKPLNFGTLSYAHFCFGGLDQCRKRYESAEAHFIEAQNAWMKGNETKTHPFNAGILYNIGTSCLYQGKVEAAIKHIGESLEITKLWSRTMPVEHGRNLFKMSEALVQQPDCDGDEASRLRDEAEVYLRKKSEKVDAGKEGSYDDCIPVYWR
ncbi:hypothetical protein V8F06_011518 [Rhypophila decipiens]